MSRPTRRNVIGAGAAATVGAVAAAVPTSAPAQSGGKAAWKLSRAVAGSRDAVTGPLDEMAKDVASLTGDSFRLTISEAAEQDATTVVAQVGKAEIAAALVDPAAAFADAPAAAILGGAPFGLNARLHAAWLADRRGLALINEVLGQRGLMAIPCGATGAAMGGWFQAEVTGADGFNGLKIAISGLGAGVMRRLGAEPVALAPKDIPAAFAAGQIGAAVWGQPYDDESLRLYQSASVLHYPGWWNGAGQLALIVNKAAYDALTEAQRTALTTAAAAANAKILARYDSQNPAALRRAVASGARLQPYGEAMLDACFAAARAEMDAIAAKDGAFKEVLASMNAMRRDGYLWMQLAETTFDTYMMIQQRKQTL